MRKKSFFLIVFTLLLLSFYASRETMPQGQFLWFAQPYTGEATPPPQEPPVVACTYQAKSKGGDNCYGDCPDKKTETGTIVKQCCDYKKDAKGECVCKDNVNPCGKDEKKCATCMAYAEAGGTKIDDSCMGAVICTLRNRAKADSTHKPKVNTICEAVAQGDGQQYNPYKCVCNSKDPNQKYCKCCAGTLTGDERKEWENAQSQYDKLDCSGFNANTFNNAGMNSWAKKHCKKITPPKQFAKCATFDFYQC